MKIRCSFRQHKSGYHLGQMILLLILVIAVLDFGLSAQTKEPARPRPPITPEDLAMSDLPELPGAPAVCLYYERIDDNQKKVKSVFKRIKILSPAGRDYANLEIPYVPLLNDVKNIKVVVYETDGRRREVVPETMDKIASRQGMFENRIKTLAIPGVSAGQIIDYEYEMSPGEKPGPLWIITDGVLSISINAVFIMMDDFYSQSAVNWELQDSIYIKKAKYTFLADPVTGVSSGGKYNMAWVTNNLRNVLPKRIEKGLELEVNDIPPFLREEFMPPENAEKISFKIYYLPPDIRSNDEYWEKAAGSWKQIYEEFMTGGKGLQKEVLALVEGATDPEVKLRKLYERVQDIKNLDYVPSMSEKEWKKIKPNNDVRDVLKRNYGYKNQIARTFAALARAAGFETYLVRVASRDEKIFKADIPLFKEQLDSEIVMVKIGNRFQAFDPGLPGCPYEMVYWPRTGTTALTFENDRMSFFTSPSTSADDSSCRQIAKLRPDGQGNLTGTIRVEYRGQEALSRKFGNREKDAMKFKEILEEELLKKLPAGSKVKLKDLTGLKERSAELAAEFEATVSGVIHEAGDKLLLPVYALTNPGRYPFRSAFRKYPVYFNYPYAEIDEIIIELPDGYEVEALPEAKTRDSERAGFNLACSQDEPGQLRVERRLAIKKNLFPVNEYIHLKEFFDFVLARDSQQIVLRKK
ncbi:MAG: DUF3857 domain-containing protein [Candidatus Saccharicenans sp.]|nr:DUF3857 domain-containing protein [Candidatus Saccharicenans sp.]MDH7575961.1 DUF3857 domain-containing protein [Candidatus Saccharicenans sp.]